MKLGQKQHFFHYNSLINKLVQIFSKWLPTSLPDLSKYLASQIPCTTAWGAFILDVLQSISSNFEENNFFIRAINCKDTIRIELKTKEYKARASLSLNITQFIFGVGLFFICSLENFNVNLNDLKNNLHFEVCPISEEMWYIKQYEIP